MIVTKDEKSVGLLVVLLLLTSNPAMAGIDTAVESVMAPVAAALSAIVFAKLPIFGYEIPWIVLWLAVAAVFFYFVYGVHQYSGLWFGAAISAW